jgi:Histidine kinase
VFEIENKTNNDNVEQNNKTLLRLYQCINRAIENMGDYPIGMMTLERFNLRMSSLYHRLGKHNKGVECEDLFIFYRIFNNNNDEFNTRNSLEKDYDKLRFLRNYLKTYEPNFAITDGNDKDYNKFSCMAYLYECEKNYKMALHFRYLAFSNALHDTTYKYSNYVSSALINLRTCLRNCDKLDLLNKYDGLLKKVNKFKAIDASSKDHLMIDTIETKISAQNYNTVLQQLDSLQNSDRIQNWYYPKYKNKLLDRIYKNKSYIYDNFLKKFDSTQFYRANSLELNLDFLFWNDYKILIINASEIELDRMKAEKINDELKLSKKKTDSLLTESRLQNELISNQKKRLENQQMTLKRFIYRLKIANEKKDNAIVKVQSANSKLALQLKKDSILISQNKILSDSLTKNIIKLNEANFEKDRTIKRNWWLASIIALLFVTLSLYIPWSSLKSKKQKLENQIVANMLNPHFMKNSVGGLLAIARINNYEKVIEPIDKVAMFLERYDKKSTNENITLSEELSNSKAYLETAKLAYETNFEIIGFDNSIELNFNIPSFLFLSVLENIIKHGFSNRKKDENQIRIDILENTNHTILKIINNGEKVIENARVGNGTTIVASKIKLANLSTKIAYTKHHNNNNDEVETTFTFLK